jgi:V8-like Glu-specific endopeptidase
MLPGRSSRQPSGRHARRAGLPLGRLTWPVSVATAVLCGLVLLTPAAGRLATAVSRLSLSATNAPAVPVNGHASTGTPAVGALFTVSGGRTGRHFCTASVVDSPVRDLVITAAHCVSGLAPSQIAFVPGYHDGLAPYGVWLTTQVVMDSAWRSSANPDHDVAFLVVHQEGSSARIQNLTGGERLGTGWAARAWVRVIGYPDTTERPITCSAESKPFGATEMEFDCGGYTDGTSGGPFIARLGHGRGGGTVIGVIGGYEEGGDIASVSYSPRFGSAVQALYRSAIALG